MSVSHENKAVSTTSEPQKNIILVDWFSFTSRINSADEIKSVPGLSYPGVNWLEINGCHGFKDRYYFNGISIHYNGSEKMGLQDLVWVEFSGQGCRAFEEFSRGCSWDELFNTIIFEDNYILGLFPATYGFRRKYNVLIEEFKQINCLVYYK